jgi:hypothetical protein
MRRSTLRRALIASLQIGACSVQQDPVCKTGDMVRAGDGCRFCQCSGNAWSVADKGCGALRPPLDGTPACYFLGLADVDPDEEGLQIECHATPERSGSDDEAAPRCIETPSGFDWPSPDATQCWYALLDDAVSDGCVADRDARGLPPAEIGVLHRPGPDADVFVDVICTHPPLCPGSPQDSD